MSDQPNTFTTGLTLHERVARLFVSVMRGLWSLLRPAR